MKLSDKAQAALDKVVEQFKSGDLSPIVEIARTDTVWVKVYLPAEHLTAIQIGQQHIFRGAGQQSLQPADNFRAKAPVPAPGQSIDHHSTANG